MKGQNLGLYIYKVTILFRNPKIPELISGSLIDVITDLVMQYFVNMATLM